MIDPDKLANLTTTQRAWLEQILQEKVDQKHSSTESLLWNKDYYDRLVPINEWLEDEYYMGKVGKSLWPRWREELEYVFSPNSTIIEWVIRGAIGTGKTMVGIVGLCRKLYEVSAMINPQARFKLTAGSPIIFAFFNIFKYLSESVAFKYFSSYIEMSPYFQQITSEFKKEGVSRKVSSIGMRNNIDVAIGADAIHAIGMNVFGGILDEADFGKAKSARSEKSQLEATYTGVRDRIDSRFYDPVLGRCPGILILVSSATTADSDLAKHVDKVKDNPTTHISDFAKWEVDPKYAGITKQFYVMVGDRLRPSKILAEGEEAPDNYRTIAVPDVEAMRQKFEYDIETALQNQAGISTENNRKFVLNIKKYEEGKVNYTDRSYPFSSPVVELSLDTNVGIEDYFIKENLLIPLDLEKTSWRARYHSGAIRAIHVDLSKNGDWTGIAMSCAPKLKPIEKYDLDDALQTIYELSFWNDFQLSVRNAPGSQIDFSKIRAFIISLRDTYGFNIGCVSYDGYQSAGSLQELYKLGFKVKQISMDKTPKPYYFLRNAHYEGRIDLIHNELYEKELLALEYEDEKIDHPKTGSKDLTDATAGTIMSLIDMREELGLTDHTEMGPDYLIPPKSPNYRSLAEEIESLVKKGNRKNSWSKFFD